MLLCFSPLYMTCLMHTLNCRAKSELDSLLDDDEPSTDLMTTQKKPWQPPTFKDFSLRDDDDSPAAPSG